MLVTDMREFIVVTDDSLDAMPVLCLVKTFDTAEN